MYTQVQGVDIATFKIVDHQSRLSLLAVLVPRGSLVSSPLGTDLLVHRTTECLQMNQDMVSGRVLPGLLHALSRRAYE
jgi:hypothetical protein